MLINTSLSPETAARDLQKSRGADASSTPAGAAGQTTGGDSTRSADAASGLQARFSLEAAGVPEIPDESGADQVTQSLRADFLSQPGSALAAQANANPESAYSLLV
jgi:hypothetical protein